MSGLFVTVGFLALCFFLGRFVFFDIWISEKTPDNNYDPDYEDYKEFTKRLKSNLKKEGVNLRQE